MGDWTALAKMGTSEAMKIWTWTSSEETDELDLHPETRVIKLHVKKI
jgi:hypothetical protein